MLLLKWYGTPKERDIKQVPRNTGLEIKGKRSDSLEQRLSAFTRLVSPGLGNVSITLQKKRDQGGVPTPVSRQCGLLEEFMFRVIVPSVAVLTLNKSPLNFNFPCDWKWDYQNLSMVYIEWFGSNRINVKVFHKFKGAIQIYHYHIIKCVWIFAQTI